MVIEGLEFTEERMQKLIQHAAAQRLSLTDTLDALLDLPTVNRLPQRRLWTEEELAAVRDPRNSPQQLARQFKRTPSAISNKRHQLAKEENRTDLMRRPRPQGD